MSERASPLPFVYYTVQAQSPAITYLAEYQCGMRLSQETSQPQNQFHTVKSIGKDYQSIRHKLIKETDSRKHDFAEILLKQTPDVASTMAELLAKATILNERVVQYPELHEQAKAWQQAITTVATLFVGKDSSNKLVTDARNRIEAENYGERLAKLAANPRGSEKIVDITRPEKGKQLAEFITDATLETAWVKNAVHILTEIEKPFSSDIIVSKLLACLWGDEVDATYTSSMKSLTIQTLFQDFAKEHEAILTDNTLNGTQKKAQVYILKGLFGQKIEPFLPLAPIHNEFIDLISLREHVLALQKKADTITSSSASFGEKQAALRALDKELETLLIPVANKVALIFPHNEFVTNLTDIVDSHMANCAGKVNVLRIVTRFLGITTRQNAVTTMHNGKPAGHAYLELDLFSTDKLVIDANASSNPLRENYTDEELFSAIHRMYPEESSALVQERANFHRKYYIHNARHMAPDTRIHIYRIKKADNKKGNLTTGEGYFTRTDYVHGREELWQASIPFPHRKVVAMRDESGIANESVYSNISLDNTIPKAIRLYCLQKCIQLNPNVESPYWSYVKLASRKEKVIFLESLRKNNPKLFWEKFYSSLVTEYTELSQRNSLLELFASLKKRDIHAYYSRLSDITSRRISILYPKAPREEIKKREREFLEEEKNQHQEIFFSKLDPVMKLADLYENTQEKIQFLEECISLYNPSEFYEHQSVYNRLITAYKQILLIEPQNDSIKKRLEDIYTLSKEVNIRKYLLDYFSSHMEILPLSLKQKKQQFETVAQEAEYDDDIPSLDYILDDLEEQYSLPEEP